MGIERGVVHRIHESVDRRQPQKVFLILDNLKVHYAKAVTEWAGERSDQIELFYVPPYTPERNPAEALNPDFKAHLRLSQRSSTSTPLQQKAETFHFLLNTSARIRAYFDHPTAHYAATTYLIAGLIIKWKRNFIACEKCSTASNDSGNLRTPEPVKKISLAVLSYFAAE